MKTFVCMSLLVVLCLSVLAVAQDSPMANITGSGKKGTVPVFTGTHAIGNSSAVQGSSGGFTITNKQADSLTPEAGGAFGVLSHSGSVSGTGSGWANGGAGVFADGGPNDSSTGLANYGVASATDNKAGLITNTNGDSYYTIYGFNYNSSAYNFGAYNDSGYGCNIDYLGDLTCSGSKNAAVAIKGDDGKKRFVALAAVESPKNWFEDFGSAELRGGVAVVKLDAKFIQTINSKLEYHVFLTPNGDCRGLYVNQKNPTTFEVRELGGGSSNVKFDYRITGLRKNFENVRFAEHPEFAHIRNDGKVVTQ